MSRFCCHWLYFAAFLAALKKSSAGRFVHTPSNKQPIEGSELSVTCSSDGGSFILWYREGEIIPVRSPDFTQTSSASGSASTLSIASVHHSLHTGQYECVVVFQDSSVARTSFNITVKYINTNVGIQFDAGSNCSSGYLLELGCRLRLECLLPDCYPNAVTVSWYRNEWALAATSEVDFSAAMRVLVIESPTFADSGSYKCRASNGIGITRNSMLIYVTVQDEGRGFSFVGSVSSEVVTVGSSLTLCCSVKDAVGDVVFQWQAERDGDRVEKLESGLIGVTITSSANRSSLLIHQTSVMDDGIYYCIATDQLSQIKQNVTISINVARAILQWPPSKVHSFEGDSIRFDCIASGQPVPVVIWVFQSTPVPVASLSSLGLQDLGNGSLVIPVLHPHHAGTYLCRLEEQPLDMHTFTLTVKTRNHLSSTARPTPSLPPLIPDPFSPTVSIVLAVVGGLSTLLLCSALLILLYCCGTMAGRRHAKKQSLQTQGQVGNGPTENCTTSHGRGGKTESRVRGREKLPLPPVPGAEHQDHKKIGENSPCGIPQEHILKP